MTKKRRVTTPLKWHGGKYYLASKIVELMPPHLVYVEACFGGGSVLLAKDPTNTGEIVYDVDGDLINFWSTIRDEKSFQKFRRMATFTEFGNPVWDVAGKVLSDPKSDKVKRAWAFFVRCRQSLAGRMSEFAPFSNSRLRGGILEQTSAWLSAVDGLQSVHDRFKGVAVGGVVDVSKVVKKHNKSKTLIYIDPPYHPDSRVSKDVYRFEMTHDDHVRLLQSVQDSRAHIIISGYRCILYDETLADWRRVDFDVPNNSAGGKKKERKLESVWLNY